MTVTSTALPPAMAPIGRLAALRICLLLYMRSKLGGDGGGRRRFGTGKADLRELDSDARRW